MFTGEAFAAPSFMVCLAAAVVPLLLSLWVFNRKAY
jgi:hypothetical protein